MATPDVAVIGGGIIGVATAAHAAARGASVVLYERDGVAAAASGRNSGVIQHPLDPVLAELHLESIDLYRALPTDAQRGFSLAPDPAGLLAVSHDSAAIRALAADLARSHPLLAPEFLGPGDAARCEPALGPEVAACRLAIGFPVAPRAATMAYAEWARARGARIELGQAARPWRTGPGRVGGVVLDDGRSIAAGAVVVAAGPWSPALVDPSGTWRPIRPVWGVVVELELAAPPRHVLEQADIDIEPDATVGEAPAERMDSVSFSLVTAGSRSVLGSTFLPSRPSHAALVPHLVDHGARFVPALSTARPGSSRACARPQSLDGRPLVGAIPGMDGLWIAAGNGPWGISTGPATGRLAADLVLGRAGAPPATLDPARFGAPPG